MKDITVKKTYEITETEWAAITEGFNEEFQRDKTAEELIRFYNSNFKNYSYHAIAKDENGMLAGFTSVNPVEYKDSNGKIFFAGLSGSTFVKKDCRKDIFVFHDLYKALRQSCANDGCKAILGVPNKNSFKYIIKLLKFKFLYDLPYYVTPVRIKNIFKSGSANVFNGLFFSLLRIYVKMAGLISMFYNPKENSFGYDIFYTDETYRLRFNESYKNIVNKGYRFTYKIYEEKNIRTAYLFDFRQSGQRTARALYKAIDYVLGNEKIEIIAFIGKLDLRQPLLLRLPKKKEPQQLPLTIDILVSETDSAYSDFSDPSCWNFGLMNFDVR